MPRLSAAAAARSMVFMVSLLVWVRFSGPLFASGRLPFLRWRGDKLTAREDNLAHAHRIYARCGGKTMSHLIADPVSPRSCSARRAGTEALNRQLLATTVLPALAAAHGGGGPAC